MIRVRIAKKVMQQKREEYRRKRAMQFAIQLQGRNLRVCWKCWIDMVKAIKVAKENRAKDLREELSCAMLAYA